MRNLLPTTCFLLFILINANAQPCSGLGGTQTGNDVIFCSSSEPLTVSIYDIPAGNYALVYVCSSNTYTFTTCNNLYLGNAEISVLDEFGAVITGVATDYINDNTCGLSGNDETLIWTPPAAYAGGGFVQVVVSQYDDLLMNPCQNIGSNADLEISATGTCAPPGTCCENPEIASGATYNATGLTTCGLTNEFGFADACGSFYLDGPEYVLEFTPSSTSCYNIEITGTGSVGAFVWDACGSGATCVASAESDTGNPIISTDLTGGVPYTILVSTDPDIVFGNTPCTDFDININSCPTGSVCSVAEAVTAPYDSGLTTTCGSGDDYTEAQAVTCGATDFYMDGDDYVYSFTPASTECYTIDISNASNWMGFFVFDDCPDGAPSCIGSSGDGFDPDPINVTLDAGVTYYIIVGSNPDGVSPLGVQCGNYQLTIDACPIGTNCGNPYVINDGPFPVNIAGETTCGLGDDYSSTNCSDPNYIDGEDMIFTFSPSMTGCYNFALTAEAYSSVLILDDCPDMNAACIGWAGSSSPNPELDVTLNAGTTYYVVVSSWPAPDCVNFDLAVDMCPPGSACVDPFVIPSAPYTQIGGTTCGFGDDYSTSPCGDNNYIDGEDYVMEFTPVTSGCYTLDFTNTDTYLGVFVWDECPATNGTQCLGFAGETGNATSLDQYLEAGNTYYFIVSTWPTPDCSNFDFALMECSNDGEDCANPVTLNTGVSQNLSTCGMGDNYDDTDACGSSFMNGEDIVFEFTPGSDGCYDIVLSGASEPTADFGLFILDDCPDNPSAICEAEGTGVASTPTVTANLIGGNTYTIVVASSICSDFTIVANSVACPPGSDCANPEIVTLGSNGSFDTNGSGDDYETTDACGGAYMGGTDFVMEFTPPADDCYNFTTSAGVGFNPVADVGLFILDGCPDIVGTNCLALDEVMDGFPMVDAYLLGGNTYTIVVGVVEFTGPLVSPSNTVFDLEITSGGTDCPSGINCGNPINLTAPGLYSDLTNCGFASDYDDTDGCMDVFMFGEETVFTFTPGTTDCYDIITSPTATSDPANDDVGLFVLTDCPDIPSADCILNETMENGFPSGSVQLEAGETYYIIVSAIDLIGATAFVDCADFNLEIIAGSMTCPSDCSNADEIFLGMNPGFSSCGAGDDYSEADIEASCGNSLDFYMNSEESVMTFTPGSSGCYIFETSNGSNFDADPALFILDACPDNSPSCVAIGVDENDMPAITAQLNGGQTYYIVFSAIEITSNSGGVITYTPSCTDFDIEISQCPPQAPVQDCNGAIAVCQNSYSYTDGFLGAGFDPNELPNGSCLLNGELNSVWFTVNVETSGDLSFLISPNDASDDYDFSAFDITDNGCEGISSGASPVLSCNYSISAGVTGTFGPSMPGSPLNNQDASGTLLNPSIEVVAGQTIVIIVSNFSTSLTGFDIDFSGSTASIVDTTAPDFDMVTSSPECDDNSLDITFDEPITCASILDCDFSITYPDNTVHSFSSVTSAECSSGNFATDFTFNLDDPLTQNGTYTVTLGSGCSGVEDNCGNVQDNTTIQFDISNCTTCSIDNITAVDATCGMDNGEATVTISGVSPFTVVIDGISVTGPSPLTVTGLSIGTHTVTVTDDSGCMTTSSVTINDTPGPTIDMAAPTDATCGNSDGSAVVTITGNGDFTVTIDGQTVTGPSPVTVMGLSPGTHIIDVSDINGCMTSGSVIIGEQESPTIDNITTVNSTCGNADGEATVNISGGTDPYTVVINGITVSGASPLTVTGLPSGTYDVDVTDDNGCTDMGSVSISDDAGPTIDMVAPTDATCGNSDGSALVTITGNGDFTVTIDGQTVTGPSPVTVMGLSPGTHTIDVTDINGCMTSGSVIIGEQESPTIDNITTVNSTCGNADGEATVNISGGTDPYTVVINGITVSGASPLTVTGLPSGTYDVDVTDDNGCTDMGSVSISDDAGPTIDMAAPTDATCGNSDGSAVVTITGNGDFTVTIDGQTVTGPSPVTVMGLSPGTHTIDVTDINGCMTSGSIIIGEQESPTIDNITTVNSTCGNADGEATVTIFGGTDPYTVVINGITVSGASPLTVTGLPSGTYDVEVTDDNGCTDMGSVSISDDAGPTIDMAAPTDATCGNSDGSAVVTITGNGDFTVTIDGQTVTGPSPVTVMGLSPGTHTIDVTDINECMTSGSVIIGEQESPTIDNITTVNSTCGNADGEATVTISGGTDPYTVVINGITVSGASPLTVSGLPSGTYDVDVTDDNGCTDMGSVSISDDAGPTIDMAAPIDATCGNSDGSAIVTITGNGDFTVTIDGQTVTGPSPVTIMGLSPGMHIIDVTDINGCMTSGSVIIGEQESPTIDNITTVNSTCGNADGEATVTISGGTDPYTVVINGITVSGASPLTVTGLPSGTYDVDVTDDNGCTYMGSVSISDDAGPTIDMAAPTDATCGDANGEVEVTISGGTAPYSVEINGETSSGNSPVTVTNLPAGTYDINVTDDNGCTTTGTVTINDIGSPILDMITPTNASCGGSDGAAEVIISGGTSPYTVTINLISETGDSPVTVTGLSPGSYNVDVVDANGCSVTGLVVIGEEESPTIDNIAVTNSTCGNADGEAIVTISGGVAPYTVDIGTESTTGSSPVTVANLPAGTYDVNVTDDNGCTTMGSVTISDDGGPMIDSVTPTDEVCGNGAGSAEVVISGGLAPYSVTVGSESATGSSPIIVTNLPAGTYSVDVVDDNGCMTSGTVIIGEIQGPTISSVDISNEICDMANGSLSIIVNGGTASINFDIGNGSPQIDDNTFVDLSAGTYTITVTDSNGCTDETMSTFENIPGVMIDDVDITDASCGMDNGEVTVSISGGNGPYTYDLSGTIQVNNGTFLDLSEGSYDLTVTDNNGCTATSAVSIGGSPAIIITGVNATDENCNNADGSATITISGGTPPIMYTLDGNTQIDDNLFTGLVAGTYDITVEDANGCTDMSSVTIDEIEGPIVDDISTIDASCGQSDGQATITISGGLAPYSYYLDGVNQSDPNNTFTGLASGSYPLVVTDDNGCTVMATVNINDADGPSIDNVDITDANCGMETGSVTVIASGGTAPLTISLDGTINGTNTFNDLLSGEYTVAVEDANGCISTQLITVGDIPGVQIDDIQTTDATCGNADGSKTINFSGGIAPYNVTCGANTQTTSNNFVTFNNLLAGTYTVVVTDANGCTDEATIIINEAEAPEINNIVTTDANCGMNNGSLTVNASGGTAPLTYDIGSGSQASNIFSDLLAGSYTITVTDANGCTDESTATINDIPGVQIDNIQTTDATCGNADGTKTINVSGGTPPYMYDCNGIIQMGNNVYTDLAAGTYTVIVTDAAGCTDSQTATISDADGPEIINVDITDATCGMSNGAVQITANGGTAPYTYYVNGVPQSSNLFTDLPSGNITILVEDANGCSVSQNEIIGDTPGVTIDDIIVTDANCGQSNGEATIMLIGGTAPFTYILDGISQTNNNTFVGLSAGTYPIEITDSQGCMTTGSVTIEDLPGVVIDGLTIIEETCGLSNGSITVNTSGGQTPYSYQIDLGSAQASNLFSDLTSGTYEVMVTDDNGCTSTMIGVVSGSDGPAIDDISSTPSNCGQADGSVTISASGGSTPYTYNLDGAIQTDPNNTFNNLASGNYPVIVTDANGCTATSTANVTDDGGATIDDVSVVNANCGMATGSVTIIASGGTEPLTYLLNGNNSGSNVFENLFPNTYNIEVIDANGCVATNSITVGDTPGVVIDSIQTTPESCGQMDGTKTIFISGGTSPYTFECDGIIQSNGFFTNLSSGTHTVVITDANGCFTEGSATIGEVDGPLITNIAIIDATCEQDNGSLITNVNNGTQPYSYDIGFGSQTSNEFTGLTSGNYTVTVTDDNGCTSSQEVVIQDSPGVTIDNIIITNSTCGQSDGGKEIIISGGSGPYSFDCNGTIQDNGIFNGLPAGNYTVIVTDANGCTDMANATISDADGPVIDNITSSPANCDNSDGSITITIIGGTSPYEVTAGGMTVTTTGTVTITDLPPSETPVSVSDANGCIATTTITIDNTPGVFIDEIIITNATCGQSDGGKEIIISGGTGPYSFDCNGTIQDNGIFVGLPAGNYTVIVSDANGCTDMADATIMDADGPVIDDVIIVNAGCGTDDGSVSISISGGIDPYDVTLDGNTQSTTGSVIFDNLAAGTYSFNVVDANGCTTSGSADVNGADNPIIESFDVTDASCNNADGSLTLNVIGGTSPYTYDIGSGSQTSNIFENLSSGTYSVTVTDENGCDAVVEVTINDLDGPSITNIIVMDASSSGNDGSITVTATGGIAPYTFNVNGINLIGNPTVTFDNLPDGTYLITVTDSNGCMTTGTATILNGDCVTIDAINATNAICDENNGTINVSASGGESPYMYALNAGIPQASNIFMNVGAGSYLITVTDAAGCSSSQMIEVLQNGSPSITNVIIVDATCGNNNGEIEINAIGGLPPYMYSVNGIVFQNNPIFGDLQANTYTLVVEDANGCQTTQQIVIDNPPQPVVDDIVIMNALCGVNDGSATFIVSGGVGEIQYAINGGAFQQDNLFENLAAGSYTYQVLDNNCLIDGIFTVSNEGSPEITDIVIANASCNEADGSVTISINEGTSPHTYTVGSLVQTDNPTFTGLSAGQYTIVVQDANGCIGSDVFTIIEEGELDINILGNLMVCEGGFTELIADPIDQGYNFQWSLNGVTTNTLLVTAADVGTITLKATKGNCVGTATVELELVPLPIANAGNPQELNCNNSSVFLDASGSSGTGITYMWTSDNGNIIGDANAATIEVNSAGTYTVIITESINGCSNSDQVVVTQANDVPNAEAGQGGTLDCDNTSIALSGLGSSQGSNFDYIWTGDDNQIIINPNTLSPTVSQVGIYTLQVTNISSGCTAVDVVEVTSDGSLPSNLMLDVVNPDCFGDTNGSITILNVEGGAGPYQYSFGGGAFSDVTDYQGLSAGNYNIVVMASNGCQYTQTVVIDDGIDLTVDLGPDQFIDFGDIANINALTNDDDDNIVNIVWSVSPEDEDFCPTCLDQTLMPPVSTFYIIEITNDKGCIAQDNLTVFVHLEQTIFVPNIFSPDNNGTNDIFFITTEENVEAHVNFMKVFDRWGNMVFTNENFEPNNPTEGWDGTWNGKALVPQVLVYVIEVEFTLETEVRTQLFKGDITIKN